MTYHMADTIARDKWDRIYASESAASMQAARVLTDYAYLLPDKGVALDLACGLGANALFLARCGLAVQAWDISARAVDKLGCHCVKNDIRIDASVRDVQAAPPGADSFDVICVSYYLERSITDDIIAALRPAGLLFYQTFIKEKVSQCGPNNPAFRLDENELLRLFSSLHILVYQELGLVGDHAFGERDTALMVAQKR